MSITQEIDAGACGLDGAELTQALLEENRSLIAQNNSLRTRLDRGFAGFIALAIVCAALALWR